MSLSRYYYLSKIILLGHILNWPWRDRKTRHDVRTSVAEVQISKYFKRYLYAVKNLKKLPIVKNDRDEKIFTIWLQGEDNAPPLIKACFNSIRKNCKQELVVLDEKTLFDYISLPDYVLRKRKKGQIKNAHFADICRVELLYRHGGIWLDSTGFATAKIPNWITDEDFFVYLVGNAGSKYSFMQNCFIRSRKGSYLLQAWRAVILEYWKREPKSFDYFMHQLLFRTIVTYDKKCKSEFEKMPHVPQDPTHVLWWAGRDDKFNQKNFDKWTAGAFFQKTAYNDAKNPIPGSYMDVMINKMYRDKK